jgi:hypothetical protein
MSNDRKNAERVLSDLKSLKERYKYLEKEVIDLSSETEYEQTIHYYDKLIINITNKLLSFPIGYRYIGAFYLKKPNIIPSEFEKHEGAVFMREDLVSWLIEKGLESPDPSYHRNVYKEPRDGAELKREDANPVYAKTLVAS